MDATKEPALSAAPAIDLGATPVEGVAAAERAEPQKLAEAPQLTPVVVTEAAAASSAQNGVPGEPLTPAAAGPINAPSPMVVGTEAPAPTPDPVATASEISATPATCSPLADAAPSAPSVTGASSDTIPADVLKSSALGPEIAIAPTLVTSAPVLAIPRRARPAGQAGRTQERGGSRAGRFGLLAACVALAACVGAAGGAASVAGLSRWAASPTPALKVAGPARSETADDVKSLRETVAQLRVGLKSTTDAVGALRSGSDSSNKVMQAQLGKLIETLDRLERAQAEPQARLARLAEAVDRLERRNAPQQHAAATTHVAPQAPAAAPVAAPETTASVKPPPLPPLNADSRTGKPVIEGWTLRSVYEGIALVQNKQYGSFEVEVGDEIMGAGTVQNIKRHEGKWVVVTNRGMIMPATSVR